MWIWYAHGKYGDGREIYREYPYREEDNYTAECDRQYELECMLTEAHDDLVWMAVGVLEIEEE